MYHVYIITWHMYVRIVHAFVSLSVSMATFQIASNKSTLEFKCLDFFNQISSNYKLKPHKTD